MGRRDKTLPIPKPNLDDANFDQIVEESKKKIPIYSSLWTDFNESDPGITFLELFAWLIDMQIYSLNRIKEKNYLKYLSLLGVRPLAARPPRLYVAFAPVAYGLTGFFKIAKLSRIKTDTPTDPNKVNYFELDEDIYFSPLRIKEVKTLTHQGLEVEDVPDISQLEDAFFYPFGNEPNYGNLFQISFESINRWESINSCVTKIENERPWISLFILLHESDLPPVAKHGSQDYPEDPKIHLMHKLQWEYKFGNDNPSSPGKKFADGKILDETNGLTNSGRISFEFPIDEIKTEVETSIFSVICRLVEEEEEEGNKDKTKNIPTSEKSSSSSIYHIPPRISAISINVAPATQGLTAGEYLLNASAQTVDQEEQKSNGLANQVFKVKETDKIPFIAVHRLAVMSETECNYEWTKVDDFDSSTPVDKHYVINESKGTITFGDGKRGKIPPKDSRIYLQFRYGDIENNIVIKSRSTFKVFDKEGIALPKIKAISIADSTVAAAAETTNAAIVRARSELKIPFRAVSASDYEYIAMHTPGLRVARAKAFNPSVIAKKKVDEGGENKMKVIVVPCILPCDLSGNQKKPMPNYSFMRTVSEHLDNHRLITTKVEVTGPTYVGVSIAMTIILEPKSDKEAVKRRLQDKLKRSFSAGCCSSEGEAMGWEFGKAVYQSDIYAMMETVGGINYSRDLSMQISQQDLNNAFYDPDGNIIISNFGLVSLQSCTVIVRSSDDIFLEIWDF